MYSINYSRRRTIGLYIRDGKLEVRAPIGCSQLEIDKLVKAKANWIQTKLALTDERAKNKKSFVLNFGSEVLYRGKLYKIVPKDGNKIGIDDDIIYMPPDFSMDEILHACIKLYRHLAKSYLLSRVPEIAEHMNVTPSDIKVNSAKTRWGSCSSKKSLNFSWRLILADDGVIDYVIVHELAHIFQMNHSRKFWAIVEKVLPDYKKRQARLRTLQNRLANENWH